MAEPFVPSLADEIAAVRSAVRLAEHHDESWKARPCSEASIHAMRRLASFKAVLNRLLSIPAEGEC